MAAQIIEIADFQTVLYTESTEGPIMTLEYEGPVYDVGVRLTVEQAKQVMAQLQEFVTLSAESASESA